MFSHPPIRAVAFAALALCAAGGEALLAQGGELSRAKPKPIAVGQLAPEFVLLDQEGRERSLAALLEEVGREQTPLLVIFYGRAFAPASTAQLRYFKEKLASFEGTPPLVVGIAPDDVAQSARFHEFLELPFDLLSDPDQRVAKLYGASLASAAATGNQTPATSEGPSHAVFVVHPKGHVTFLDRDFRSTPADDFRQLLRALILQTTRAAASTAASSDAPQKS